jgi:hypothetical protein
MTEVLKGAAGSALEVAGRFYRLRTRGLLVVSEVALAVVLLIGAGLMLKSLGRQREIDVGFSSEKIVTTRVQLPGRMVRRLGSGI